MKTATMFMIVLGSLVAAILLGRALRRLLPTDHLSGDSKDAVKLAMGLVATMTALVLGLLVSSAKGAYDTERSEIIQMAGNVAYLDRVLSIFGPEANEARTALRQAVTGAVHAIWPDERGTAVNLAPDARSGEAVLGAIQRLSPHNEMQQSLKAQAMTVSLQLGQVRSLLVAQGVPSISTPMLIILVTWLCVIFLGFSLLAPPNTTTLLALLVSALSVSAAIFLILELDEPFGGFIRISSEPVRNALNRLEQPGQ